MSGPGTAGGTTRAPASGGHRQETSDGPDAPAARVRDLRKVFGRGDRRITAVDGVDLDVPAGAVFGMLGPNGSGKTTLIRMLLGLTRPTSGRVELLGRPVPDGLAATLPDVGALVEGPGFHPFLTGRENLTRAAALEPRLTAARVRSAVEEALDRVGLAGAAGRRFRGYSLGMKQRLGLAAALLVPRRLVVLDEPTNGLDPAGTREIRAVVAELRASGATVLLSSHLLSEVEAVCTHVAVLKSGSLLASGELGRLLDGVADGWEVDTVDVDGALAALRGVGALARPHGDGIVVDDAVEAPSLFAALVRDGVPVHGLRRRRPDLEELFTRLTEEDA